MSSAVSIASQARPTSGETAAAGGGGGGGGNSDAMQQQPSFRFPPPISWPSVDKAVVGQAIDANHRFPDIEKGERERGGTRKKRKR